ncbi:transcriptional repressor [Siccirubricoccus deserti]|uniref:Transcriptional repressor n=1 Tax=Siccirubricoccus deserti TaxID=2013562 RepID=A0A9X0R3L5_9PROT|nr:transcriptional repressor [Siccirubricoccus deserti]
MIEPPLVTPSAALARIAASCASRGIRLTATRRLVLGLLLEAERPLGAYLLMERLRATTRQAVSPPTVYRALDFLARERLVHRIERLDAFVACAAAARDGGGHAHLHQFLVCRRCGRAEEIHDPAVALALSGAAGQVGFSAHRMTVELEGECARCAAPKAEPRHQPPT